MFRDISINDIFHKATLITSNQGHFITIDGDSGNYIQLRHLDDINYCLTYNGQDYDIKMVVKGEQAFIKGFGRTFTVSIADPVERASALSGGGADVMKAPMPGTVVEISAAEGEAVSKGQALMTIESMKILTIIAAPRDGVIETIAVEAAATFEKNAVLVKLQPETEEG